MLVVPGPLLQLARQTPVVKGFADRLFGDVAIDDNPAAVESLIGGAAGTEATAIVYTNTTSTTTQTLNFPSMKYLSYRLDLKRFGRDWRVTKMTTITSLDLTPKL